MIAEFRRAAIPLCGRHGIGLHAEAFLIEAAEQRRRLRFVALVGCEARSWAVR